MSLRSFFLFFLALPSVNADVISLIQKGLSLEFEEAQMDINEIVPEDNLNYESEDESSSSSESSMTRGLLDSRLNKDDRAILTALRSIEDMGKNGHGNEETIRRAPAGMRGFFIYKRLGKGRLCPEELRWSGAQASNLWAGRLAVVRFHLLGVLLEFCSIPVVYSFIMVFANFQTRTWRRTSTQLM